MQVKRIFGVFEDLEKENWTLIYLHAFISGYTCMQVQLTSQMICRLQLYFLGFCEQNYSTASLEYFRTNSVILKDIYLGFATMPQLLLKIEKSDPFMFACKCLRIYLHASLSEGGGGWG